MDLPQRIAQFENMTRADPTNDMAHFSLGSAYHEAGRFQEAADSFLRCIQLNPHMSKAHQLAGAAYIAAGQTSRAADILTEGYGVAAARGDRLPMKAMAQMLTELGRPVPEAAGGTALQSRGASGAGGPGGVGGPEAAYPEGAFIDHKTGRPGTRMPRPPFRGPVGQWIQDHISQETFQEWIGQGTKVINELRLDLSRDQDAETYDRYMREFLGIDEGLYEELRGG